MTESDFIKADSRNLPMVRYVAIMEYIASSNKHNLAEIRGAKILISSRDSYLKNAVGYVQVRRTGSECTVQARIVPEHKITTKPYTVMCKIDEANESIIESTCADCAASAGGCKHSLLLLFWLANKTSEPASTSTVCYWNKPALATARTEHISSKDIFPKAKRPKLSPKDLNVLISFIEECQKRKMVNSLILGCDEHNPKSLNQLNQSLNIFDLTVEFVEITAQHDYTSFKNYLSSIISKNVIDKINKNTIGQSDNTYWHSIRQGRLTASKLHEAAHCNTADGSLVEQILGGYKVPETKEIRRGRKLETAVLNETEKLLDVKINKSGIVLINGITGASPNGITDDFVIEIKCPATEKAVKTYIKNNAIQNKFKTQIQCQMLACKKYKGLFCVADPQFETTKKVNLIWETFDEVYITNVLSKAEHFWERYIFPKLLKSAKS